MFICGMRDFPDEGAESVVGGARAGTGQELRALLDQVPGWLFVHVIEHRLQRWSWCALRNGDGLAETLIDVGVQLLFLLGIPVLVVQQTPPQALDRVALHPWLELFLAAIAIRSVAGR